MREPYIPSRIIPPGINDERSRALIDAYSQELENVALEDLLIKDALTVDARLLPAMTVARSMSDFVYPGIKETHLRSLLDDYHSIHAKSGYISGVRRALSAFDLDIEWVQWFNEEPKAPHNTHKVNVFFNDILVEGNALASSDETNLVLRLIHLTQRWSQDVAVTFSVLTKGSIKIGAISHVGGVVRHGNSQIKNQKIKEKMGMGVIMRVCGRLSHRSAMV